MPGNVASHQPCGLSSGQGPPGTDLYCLFLAHVHAGVTVSPGVSLLGFGPDFSAYSLCELGPVNFHFVSLSFLICKTELIGWSPSQGCCVDEMSKYI